MIVIYGDTDSVMIKSPELTPEIADDLSGQLTEHVQHWVADRYKVKVPIIFETGDFFVTFYMANRKKAYIGRTIDGRLVKKGFELKRRDWVTLAKEIQEHGLNLILDETEDLTAAMTPYLRKLRAELKAGKLNHKIIYTKNLRKELEEYKIRGDSGLPPHVRAAKILAEQGKLGNYAVVQYVVTDVSTVGLRGHKRQSVQVAPFIDASFDIPITRKGYDYLWEHQVAPILERLGCEDLSLNITLYEMWSTVFGKSS